MPAPPARSRSASVPCGVSSSSISPLRYWRANSLFSPTYEPIARRMRPAARSSPSPQPSTPRLLDTISRSVVSLASSARISSIGTPLRPNPPTAIDAPSGMSATASAADATLLSMSFLFLSILGAVEVREDPLGDAEGAVGRRHTGVDGGLQEDLGELLPAESVAEPRVQVELELVPVARGDEARDGDGAAHPAVEPGARPDAAPRELGD